MKKSTRKLKAEQTIEIIEKGYYTMPLGEKIDIKEEIDHCIDNTELYLSEDLDDVKRNLKLENNQNTVFEVTHEDSVSAIHRIHQEEEGKVMCLNFASAKNPGGGFLNGALAQEESLAVSSALYGSQMSAFDFYDTHRSMKSCIYTDAMIHSPNVPVFRDRRGELVADYSVCGLVTSAAVNYGVVKRKELHLVDKVNEVMNTRIEKLLSLCAEKKYNTLILGAWGCGVFQNDPNDIAKLFKSHFDNKFKNQFKRVVFAIYSKNEKFIEAFQKEFD
ncbi:TIGR02452 family protein [uncultured Tenacibaculum sp.]|uniref:TIGR02452 family protein n=1 Tax=uncultured Tenacibaculum sp. TaxID=174713 RepID=UPI002617AD5D|nr:TIGR02452 family protein [uncultured Tenacibaculum sp.]